MQLESEDFPQGLHLVGASELIKAQHGYAWNPVTQQTIADWPAQYIVIADEGGDPLCLDLGHIEGHDAPVRYAMHGSGRWDFEPYSASFVAFIAGLSEKTN